MADQVVSSGEILRRYEAGDRDVRGLEIADGAQAVFRGAMLDGADFRQAALCTSSWVRAKLAGAVFDGAFCHSHLLEPGAHPDW